MGDERKTEWMLCEGVRLIQRLDDYFSERDETRVADQLDEAVLSEMRAHALMANDAGFTRIEVDPLHLAEIIERLLTRLKLAPGEPQPDAPTDIAALPDYWDERRRKQGKPDLSRCAAELRIALRAKGGERG